MMGDPEGLPVDAAESTAGGADGRRSVSDWERYRNQTDREKCRTGSCGDGGKD